MSQECSTTAFCTLYANKIGESVNDGQCSPMARFSAAAMLILASMQVMTACNSSNTWLLGNSAHQGCMKMHCALAEQLHMSVPHAGHSVLQFAGA